MFGIIIRLFDHFSNGYRPYYVETHIRPVILLLIVKFVSGAMKCLHSELTGYMKVPSQMTSSNIRDTEPIS